MSQKLTKEQINEYIINNIQTDIVKDTEYGMLKVFFKIKITGKVIYGSHLLYHIITAPLICNWQKCTIERIINKFHEYIRTYKPDAEYIKLCECLNLPDEIKNSPERFDIANVVLMMQVSTIMNTYLYLIMIHMIYVYNMRNR